MKTRFILVSALVILLASCTLRDRADYLIVTVDYSSGMMGSSADLTIIRQEHPFVWMPVYDQAAMPLDVVFRDPDGGVVTRKSMTVAHFDNSLMYLDAPLTVRWVTWVENDPQYACVGFETGPDEPFHSEHITVGDLPIPLCE